MSDPADSHAVKRRQHLLIFLTVLIDLIGFGILIPILQPLAQRFDASNWQLTMLLGIYSLMQFVFSPIMGRISDRVGRRPVLIASLFGSLLGYLVLMAAAWLPMSPGTGLAVLYGARILTGIAGASVGTAQSYLADITAPEKRAGVMGMIGAAFGLGFMIGPVIGGFSGPYLNGAAPFVIAAGLSAVNLLFVWKNLPETLPPEARRTVKDRPSVLAVMGAHKGTPLPRLLTSGFLSTTAFAMMTSTFILFTAHHFKFGTAENGGVFFFIGIIGVIIQGGLIRRIARPDNEARLALSGMACMVVALALLPLTTPWVTLLCVNALMAVGNSLATPTLNSLASRCGTTANQGLIMGAMQGSSSLGRFAGAMLAGPLLYVQEAPATYGRWALWVSALIMVLAFLTVPGRRAAAAPPATA